MTEMNKVEVQNSVYNEPLQQAFKHALRFVADLSTDPLAMSEISPCTRLDFYGLWTVHNYGPNVEEKNPYPWSIIKSHKWLAWKKAGSLTKEESMEAFIMKVIEVLKSLPYTKERQDLLYLLERRKKSPVIVYGDPTDPPCLAVTWLCVLGNIPHDFETITANKIPASFLSISPHAHVPVINDNGFVVSECSSILRYLSAAYRLESRFYPQDLLTRTKIDQYLDWLISFLLLSPMPLIHLHLSDFFFVMYLLKLFF
eukprot:TRINITY_DN8578_c0_g1_i15.p1 TRINITY_DN8578_c0_g1~~TRINITY_DN8578_c0_g1_i15.p1  ORF type:complete len:256 (-),score=33.56 TRINITY_DN8578_c0_g1_i15:265-1032(-)